MSPRKTKVDVLVVGAGPAGLICANALAQAGDIVIKVIDIKPTRVQAGQADGFVSRTLEMLQSYGLAESMMQRGAHSHTIAFYNHSEDVGGIVLRERRPIVSEPTARYPHLVHLSQADVEDIVGASLETHGARVDRPVKPKSVTIEASGNLYPIKVKLSNLDNAGKEIGTEEVEAEYLVGTDGAHSWVRSAVGIQMLGDSSDNIWGAVDFKPSSSSNFPDWRNIGGISSKDQHMILIPRERGLMRVYVDLGTYGGQAVDPITGRLKTQANNIDVDKLFEIIKSEFKPFILEPEVGSVEWWTAYVAGQRVASSMSVEDRVFIAGDAAHTHSPKAGQGMNTSMNDSHNLAWKLVYSLRGWGKNSLLETYNSERLKIAQDLVAFDKWYAPSFSAKARQDHTGNEGVMSPLQIFAKMNDFTSGIGVHYPVSALNMAAPSSICPLASKLVIGKRLPPHRILRIADQNPVEIQDLCPSDLRFKIFVFTHSIALDDDRIAALAEALTKVLSAYPEGMFAVATIIKGDKDRLNYLDLPAALRPSWENVLVDDIHRDFGTHTLAGHIYDSYGIGEEGTIVVVRPDGYVSAVFGLDDIVPGLGQYLAQFLQPIQSA